jgi:hypothetical protein
LHNKVLQLSGYKYILEQRIVVKNVEIQKISKYSKTPGFSGKAKKEIEETGVGKSGGIFHKACFHDQKEVQ